MLATIDQSQGRRDECSSQLSATLSAGQVETVATCCWDQDDKSTDSAEYLFDR